MVNKYKTFEKNFLNKRNTNQKLLKNISLLKSKNISNYKNYISKVHKLLNPLFLKINNTEGFSYNILKDNLIQIFYCKKDIKNLLLELHIENLTPHNLQNQININLNYYKNNNSIEENLECFIFIGDISEYLLKNKSKLIFKITSFSNIFLKKQDSLKIKIDPLREKFTKKRNAFINYQLKHFIKFLKEGIELNPHQYNNPHSGPYKVHLPNLETLYNIQKIQLLNDNKLLFTYLDDHNNIQTYTYKKSNILTYIKHEIMEPSLIFHINYPKVYFNIIQEEIKILKNS
jgi:hypothetical protein